MLPIERPQKIICIGLNYRDHAAETGMERRFHRTYPHLASVVRVAQRLQAWRFDF